MIEIHAKADLNHLENGVELGLHGENPEILTLLTIIIWGIEKERDLTTDEILFILTRTLRETKEWEWENNAYLS
ncbi:MAG: hypothetical protein IKU30_08700 [Clostridia bacterium]|nr:hypothetical protein [Clostridia bacterium]